MRCPRRHLESVSGFEGPRALAIDVQLQPAFDDIARFNSRMGVASDDSPRVEINARVDGLLALRRPVHACEDGALQSGGRVLRFGAARQKTRNCA
jgi:hypothetical protein